MHLSMLSRRGLGEARMGRRFEGSWVPHPRAFKNAYESLNVNFVRKCTKRVKRPHYGQTIAANPRPLHSPSYGSMSPWFSLISVPGLGFMQTHIFTGVVGGVDGMGRVVGVVLIVTAASLLHFLSLGLRSTVTHSHSWLGWHGDWYLGLVQILSSNVILFSLAVIVLFLDLPSNMLFVLFQLKWYIANISTMYVHSI